MHAIRSKHAFDGESFRSPGATVLIDDSLIIGVEPYDFPLPDQCPVTSYDGTLLPGLIEAHTHLVTDSGVSALDRVAGCSNHEIDEVVTRALRDQLAAGVTTVRDLGDRRFCVVQRRDDQPATGACEPTIVASGPPLTSTAGHCHFMGGEVSGTAKIIRAIAERVERGVDIVKVMASGGVNTPGSDVMRTQFTTAELRLVVDRTHAAGLPVTAHAHGTPAVEQAIAVGVDGIEHCSCLTRDGARLPQALAERLVEAGIYVCPTVGRVPGVDPPPHVQARLAAIGSTFEDHLAHVVELQKAGVRFLAGTDAGIGPAKRHGLVPMAVVDLVACGVPATDALASATGLAALAIGLRQRTGRLAVGLDADLLLVDGDPLSDVTALQRLRTVVSRGREVPLPRG